jgi:hypothetical protein
MIAWAIEGAVGALSAESLSHRHEAIEEGPASALQKRTLLQRSSTCRKAPYFAMHKGIAIAFLKAIDFCNKLKRTIFDVWCSDPYLSPDA